MPSFFFILSFFHVKKIICYVNFKAQTRRLEDSIKSNGTLKENSQILETELLNSRQEVAQFDIILKRSW